MESDLFFPITKGHQVRRGTCFEDRWVLETMYGTFRQPVLASLLHDPKSHQFGEGQRAREGTSVGAGVVALTLGTYGPASHHRELPVLPCTPAPKALAL